MKIGWKNWIETNREQLKNLFKKQSWKDNNKLIDLPAELTSLKGIKEFLKNGKKPLNEKDKVILIHSDNTDGQFCAKILQELVSKLLNLQVERKKFQGLAPTNRNEFGRALQELWKYVDDLCENNEIILNLTGGYKVLGILLGGLARQRTGTNVFYLHEEAGYDQIFFMRFKASGKIDTGYFDIPKMRVSESLAGP